MDKKVKKRIKNTIIWAPALLYYNVRSFLFRDVVFCECYIKHDGIRFKKHNWGDDLNYYFFNYISGKRFVFIPYKEMYALRPTHYSLIGSIIGNFNLDKTIIYGSGFREPEIKINGVPEKILSVRGPLTRDILLSKGFDCPANYGDPALLLPIFYQPSFEKKYSVTLVPHHRSYSEALCRECEKRNIHVINMGNYDKWTDIIDEICASRLVISESLHGLIVSEAYNIPSVWVGLAEYRSFWPFKYQDFYHSIGKYNEKMIQIKDYDFSEAIRSGENWIAPDIDFDALLANFPFTYKKKMKKI